MENIIECRMSLSDHPSYGNLVWEKSQITRAGQVVFADEPEIVAERWNAICDKLNECEDESELVEFFDEIFESAPSGSNDCRVCGQTPCNCTFVDESAAGMGRAAELDWVTHIEKHPKHAGTAINNVNRAHPASAPHGHKFAVMHSDGKGWSVTKHERIETAAREFGKHTVTQGRKVKLVNHKGEVIHANYEEVILPDELQALQEAKFL